LYTYSLNEYEMTEFKDSNEPGNHFFNENALFNNEFGRNSYVDILAKIIQMVKKEQLDS
jgi:hypothetical protein